MKIQNKKLCKNCFSPISSEPCGVCGYCKGMKTGDPSVLPRGTKLNGRYILGGVIGRGGFGITYLAYDIRNSDRVCVKEYFPCELAYRGTREKAVRTISAKTAKPYEDGEKSFFNESETLARFSGDPNIVNVRDSFCENNTAYCAMEYLDGVTLEKYVAENGALSCGEAVYLAEQTADALYAIHSEGILHRDISPDNIMLCKDGGVKLIDFGAARRHTQSFSPTMTVMMKTGFTAIEQYSAKGNSGTWTDIYSLGTVMFYALTGRTPSNVYERMENDSDFTEALSYIPEKLRSVILTAADIVRQNRYESAAELRSALSMTGIRPVKISVIPKKSAVVIENVSVVRPGRLSLLLAGAAGAAVSAAVLAPFILFNGRTDIPQSPESSAALSAVSVPARKSENVLYRSTAEPADAVGRLLIYDPDNTSWRSATPFAPTISTGSDAIFSPKYSTTETFLHFSWLNWSGADWNRDGQSDEQVWVRWGDIKDKLVDICFDVDGDFPSDRNVEATITINFIDPSRLPERFDSASLVSGTLEQVMEDIKLEGRCRLLDENSRHKYVNIVFEDGKVKIRADLSDMKPSAGSSFPDGLPSDDWAVQSFDITFSADRGESETKELGYGFRGFCVYECERV